jgi:hypothetical protein
VVGSSWKRDFAMWLPADIVKQVEKVARIRYVSRQECELWNANRRRNELRLLTGWEWIERGGDQHCQGFKTMTVAYRDAYYRLIKSEAAPSVAGRASLRVVA